MDSCANNEGPTLEAIRARFARHDGRTARRTRESVYEQPGSFVRRNSPARRGAGRVEEAEGESGLRLSFLAQQRTVALAHCPATRKAL